MSLAIGLVSTGCTSISQGGPPTIIHSTPFGSTVISQGGQPTGGGPATPPPGLTPDAPPASVVIGSRDGVYAGVAVPLNTGGGLCIRNQTIAGFTVHGDAVRWGRFRGRIENDGLQMVNGNTWVFGQFDGPRFNGQISANGPRGRPGCTFMMTLEKTGA